MFFAMYDLLEWYRYMFEDVCRRKSHALRLDSISGIV